MAYERHVGLTVKDEAGYQSYREAMTPLLTACGGKFRFDFLVSKTLKSEGAADINRVFVLWFPDRATKERFFADPAYLAIRAKYYEPSVKAATTIAEFETP